jgi:hypothetical protein
MCRLVEMAGMHAVHGVVGLQASALLILMGCLIVLCFAAAFVVQNVA